MPCHAMSCHAMPCHTIQCNTMQYNTIHTIQYNTIMPCHAMPYNTMQYNAIQYNTYNTIQYNRETGCQVITVFYVLCRQAVLRIGLECIVMCLQFDMCGFRAHFAINVLRFSCLTGPRAPFTDMN